MVYLMRTTPLDTCRGYLAAQAGRAARHEHSELPLVTISREAEAGAVSVARLVAERLNTHHRGKENGCPWTVFDRNLVEKVLEDHELPGTLERFIAEDATAFSPSRAVEEILGLHPSDWTLAHHTTETIHRLARMGNVILVGRGANIIAAGQKNAFHVRLVAPLDVRIKRAAEANHLTDREAAVFVRQKDHARRRYVKQHFHVAIDDPLHYHATLNTGLLSFEETARLIADAVLHRNG